MPFSFHNTELVPCCNVPGLSDRLEDEVSGAWLAFARTGDPNCRQIPEWKRYTQAERYCMVFGNRESFCKKDFDNALAAEIYALRREGGWAL